MARDISQLHPELQNKITKLTELCKGEGLPLGIGECFRSVQEQDELYAQGRTKPGSIITNAPGSSYSSQHQWGIAFDFYKNVAGHAYDDDTFFSRVAALAKGIGLAWGGDWTSFVDRPHLYLPSWGSTTTRLKQEYGTFNTFKATWDSSGEGDAGDSNQTFHAIGTATCTGNGVRVRITPNGTPIGKLYKGNRFEVNGVVNNGWHQIRVVLNSVPYIGWISGDYVKPDASNAASSGWVATGTATSTGNDVRIRSTPDATVNNNILLTLNKGNRFEIDGQTQNGFYHIKVKDTIGWISGLYVKED